MDKKPLIRQADRQDVDDILRLLRIIADLHRDARPDMFPHLESKYDRDTLSARLSSEDNGITVAVCYGRTVGYIFTEIISEGDGKTLYIDDLCVDPDYRRHGLATLLMDSAVEKGRERGCMGLMLNVWEFNASALEFYKRYGFKTRTRHLELNF